MSRRAVFEVGQDRHRNHRLGGHGPDLLPHRHDRRQRLRLAPPNPLRNVVYSGASTIEGEAFNVCVGGKFHVGAIRSFYAPPPSIARLNLLAASPAGKGNESLNRPFTQSGSTITFLPQTGITVNCSDNLGLHVPAYNLDSLKLGQIVSLITENRPVTGLAANGGGPNFDGTNADGTIPAISTCIGVRTTFQVAVGTCKLWKVRKYFNTCSSKQVLTDVKELEQMSWFFTGGQKWSPTGGVLSAVALLDTPFNQLVSLTTGNTGANPVNADPKRYDPSAAGSVSGFDPWLSDELFSCRIIPGYPTDPKRFTSAQVSRFPDDWLELFLSWFPGGVTLQPYGSKTGGFEKVLTYFLDIE